MGQHRENREERARKDRLKVQADKRRKKEASRVSKRAAKVKVSS